MKIKKSRLQNVIENDRLLITTETSSLIAYDLKRLLDNYFNVEGEVVLSVNLVDNRYNIEVKANATGVKTFSVIKN